MIISPLKKIAFALTSLMFESLLANALSVYAAPFPDRGPRAQQQLDNIPILGASISSNAQQDLCSNSTDAVIVDSINKEMWVAFVLNGPGLGHGDRWIEAGAKKGGIAKDDSLDIYQNIQINWSGHFVGYKLIDDNGITSFYNLPIGAKNPTGVHTYLIKQVSVTPGIGTQPPYANWAVFIDGAKVKNIPRKVSYINAVAITVGIENKDNTNNFASGTVITNWQYISTNFKTFLVPGSNVINSDRPNPDPDQGGSWNYKSVFTESGGNNKVTLSTTKPCALSSLSKKSVSAQPRQIVASSPAPEVVWKANRTLPKSQFMSRAEAIGKIPTGYRLMSATFRPYGDYEADTFKKAGLPVFHRPDTSVNRMVWVVTKALPNGYDTGDGLFDDAKKILVIDAETRQVLDYGIEGKERPGTSHKFDGLPKASLSAEQFKPVITHAETRKVLDHDIEGKKRRVTEDEYGLDMRPASLKAEQFK